jgi:hypothetical protein
MAERTHPASLSPVKKSFLSILCIGIAVSMLAPSVQAQSVFIDEASDAVCTGFTGRANSSGGLAVMLKEQAVDLPAVCRCTRTRLKADPRLEFFQAFSTDEAKLRLQSDEKLKSYFLGRAISSLMGCLQTGIDEALAKSTALP